MVRRWARRAVLVAGGLLSIADPLIADELRIGFPSDVASLDPADHRSRSTEILLRNLFSSLMTRDPRMRLVDELAVRWDEIEPGVFDFRLRDGIRLHDGRMLTADDVAFSFERLIQPGALGGRTSPRKGMLGPLVSVETVDRLTVRFRLGSVWPDFVAMLPFQQIVGRPADGGAGSADRILSGTGPFRLVAHFPDEALVLERFDGYFGGAPDMPPVGPACVDRVEVTIVPGNESRVAGLLAGDFDIVVDLLPHSIPVVERHPNTDVRLVAGTRSFFIAMNLRQPPFDDLRVRRAVAHAIDRDRLVAAHLGGQATIIDGILSPLAFGKSEDLTRYDHDPQRARALLAEAGYPNGLDLELDVARQHFDLAESIGVQLAAAGIRTQTVTGEARDIQAKWDGEEGGPAPHLWLRSWGNASLEPGGILDPTHRTGGRGNAGGYSSASLDAQLDAAASELDPLRRADLYGRAEAIANRDLPYVYLWVPKDIYGVSERVRGFAAASDGRLNLQDVCLDPGQ